jgi:peptide-methionine (R)-S-oxide reductase
MDRRTFIKLAGGAAGLLALPSLFLPRQAIAAERVGKISRSDAEWKQLLTPAQYEVLRRAGTEAPFTSPLDHEKRSGMYLCVACELPLFPRNTNLTAAPDGRAFTMSCPVTSRPPSTTSCFCLAPSTIARAAAATTVMCSMMGRGPLV